MASLQNTHHYLRKYYTVGTYSNSDLWKCLELTVSKNCDRFSPSWPPFSFSMGPVDPSVENPGKNTDWINLYPMDHLSPG